MELVICCWCHTSTAADATCQECKRQPALKGEWALLEMLGHGAAGHTWKARHMADGHVVAIKELSFRRLTDLKQFDLFQREAATLKSLSHRAVPNHEADFVVEDERFVSFYLVQEFIEGEVLTLDAPMDEARVRHILDEMADVLGNLGSRRPPVVHRDIKPANIMRRGDGSYVLIDFGATRAAAGESMGGSTVAGTFGYMAPEQLLGRSSPSSDIYGLGATAVALLAGRDASEIVDPHKPRKWRRRVTVSKPLRSLLESMLQVDEKRRLSDPGEIRRQLAQTVGTGDDREFADQTKSGSATRERASGASLAEVRALLSPEGEKESWRDVIIKIGRTPVGQLGWLLGLVVAGMVALWAFSLVFGAVTDSAPPLEMFIFWPVCAVVIYVGLAVVGSLIDEAPAPLRRVLRFRRVRRALRRTYRASGWMRLFILIPFGFPLVLLAGSVSEALTGSFPLGVSVLAGLVFADQIQAALRGRNGWRRALHTEFDAVWPAGSEERKLFGKLATTLWCGVPGFMAKSSVHKWFYKQYQAMERLSAAGLSDGQREHIALVMLVCHAAFGDDEPLRASIQGLEKTTPRRATVQALLAAVDEAEGTERAATLAALYLDERRRAD